MTSPTLVSSCAANARTPATLREKLVFCWLDSHICEQGQCEREKSYFQSISKLISKWKFFDSTDKFQNYIHQNVHVTLITIMSGRFARQLLPLVSPKQNLHSFYVFTFDIERSKRALPEEPKLKGVFNTEDALYTKIQDDLCQLFWEEGTRLATNNQDSEARVYFDEAKRLANKNP